jgi:hypothetical protein
LVLHFLDVEFSLEGFDNGKALRPLFGRTKPGENDVRDNR